GEPDHQPQHRHDADEGNEVVAPLGADVAGADVEFEGTEHAREPDLSGNQTPFALSVMSIANEVEAPPSFRFGPIFVQYGTCAKDERDVTRKRDGTIMRGQAVQTINGCRRSLTRRCRRLPHPAASATCAGYPHRGCRAAATGARVHAAASAASARSAARARARCRWRPALSGLPRRCHRAT